MILRPEDVEDIVKVLDSTSYDELELETERFVLRLRRGPGGWTQEREVKGEPRIVTPPDPPGVQERQAEGGDKERGDKERGGSGRAPEPHDDTLHAVRAPLPGVFYRAPKPGEPAFVEVGDHVDPDTVVAILETMKLMNPVRAGASGVVAEFALANNEPAEKGAVLLWVAPDDVHPDADR